MIDQLGLNQTYFYQLALFAVAFVLLRVSYFAPLMTLIKLRHERTVADRTAAEKLEAENDSQIQAYRERLAVIRAELKATRDLKQKEIRKEEALILSSAREDAKKVSQAAAQQAADLKAKIADGLSGELDSLAQSLTKRLLGER